MASYRTFMIKLNSEKDAARIAWLESQANYTDTIRTLIDQAVKGDAARDDPAVVDLGAIRAVFETVLEEKLSGLTVGNVGQLPQGEDAEAAAKLDAMF